MTRLKFLSVFLIFFLSSCVTLFDSPPDLGPNSSNVLLPCPDKPNCVSSFESPEKSNYLQPWDLTGQDKDLMAKLKKACESVGTIRWLKEENNYLRGVFVTTIMRYPDDVEFLYDSKKELMHFRSASRFGYSDLGKNRNRLVEIHKGLLVAP